MRQSADFRFQLRAPKSLHLLESCTNVVFLLSTPKIVFLDTYGAPKKNTMKYRVWKEVIGIIFIWVQIQANTISKIND